MNNSLCTPLIELYEKALKVVSNSPCIMAEIDRARRLTPTTAESNDFLREYAWTVFNSGMKMQVIKKKWPDLEVVFHYWNCRAIVDNESDIRTQALNIFNNVKKVNAVIRTAKFICDNGWSAIRDEMLNQNKSINNNLYPSRQFMLFISELPWMGGANRRYLPKNLGFDLAKNDRQLRRLAKRYEYSEDAEGVQRFCEDISKCVSERVAVVDTVLWNACNMGAI